MAFKTFYESARCFLFEDIAEAVWYKIIRAHQVSNDEPELGLTSYLITEILQHRRHSPSNFDVYIKPSWKEKLYGSDIDVFVERHPGVYRWFALQAKVLKHDGYYGNLNQGAVGEPKQWEKLALLESISHCKAYYLFYNGKENTNFADLKDCKSPFDVSQFGCSLVEPRIVERLAGKGWVSFEDFHPRYAQPWRKLTCCYHLTNPSNWYTAEQLEKSNANFTDVSYLRSSEDFNLVRFTDVPNAVAVDDPITTASEEAKWDPGVRFIINLTQSL